MNVRSCIPLFSQHILMPYLSAMNDVHLDNRHSGSAERTYRHTLFQGMPVYKCALTESTSYCSPFAMRFLVTSRTPVTNTNMEPHVKKIVVPKPPVEGNSMPVEFSMREICAQSTPDT